jgi:inhibitor of KinA
MEYSFQNLGDLAVVIDLGVKINHQTRQSVQEICSILKENPQTWIIEYVPAFTTVTVYYDPLKVIEENSSTIFPFEAVCNKLGELLTNVKLKDKNKQRIIEIPVYYGGTYGPDLNFVADYNNLTPDEVIEIHTKGEYIVHMIGFAPGFPYIGGMSERIATPRRKTPRAQIPSRSVGIGGNQTGIYPLKTPGGWQIIGRTPVELFTPKINPPSLLKAGDQIVFRKISEDEYLKWGKQNNAVSY